MTMWRRIWLIPILLLLFTQTARAQVTPAIPAGQISGLAVLTTAATAGGFIDLRGSGIRLHRIDWYGSGTISTCQVRLENSTNGTTIASNIIVDQTCTSNGTATLTSSVANYVRINASTLTGTGTLRVRYTGYIDQLAFGSSPLSATISTAFEDAARFSANLAGGGAANFGANGLDLETSVTASSAARIRLIVLGGSDTGMFFPAVFSVTLSAQSIGTDLQTYAGLGSVTVNGTSVGLATEHYAGFKLIRAASGNTELFAVQAGGTAETSSAALTTVVANDQLDLVIEMPSASMTNYWWRRNNGAWSSGTTLTTNMPTALSQTITVGASNVAVATASVMRVSSTSYVRY